MHTRNPTLASAIVTLLAFTIAVVVSVWRLLEEGPRPLLLVPAICFPIATAVWSYLMFRRQSRAAQDDF